MEEYLTRLEKDRVGLFKQVSGSVAIFTESKKVLRSLTMRGVFFVMVWPIIDSTKMKISGC
jgi:hypothetical protein